MGGKMNAGQKRVSGQIRAFCKKHAFMAQFSFKLFPLDLYNSYRQRIALCESGVVTVCVGATIDNWRDYPTRTLQRFLDAARRLVAAKLPAVTDRSQSHADASCVNQKTPTTIVSTSHFISKKAALKYYAVYDSDRSEVNRKIKDGELSIGTPAVPAGMSCSIDREEGRYFLKPKDKK
jgi:hypothetical protein